MRKTVLVLLVLFTVQLVSGFPLNLEVNERTTIDTKPAQFTLQGTNNLPQNRSFRISSIQTVPKASNWFSYSNPVKVKSGENFSLKLNITAPENAIQGNYGFTINTRTVQGDNLESRTGYFTVDSDTDLAITSYSTESGSFLPGETVSSNLTIINTASEPVRDVGFEASLLGEKTSRSGFQLPPGAKLSQRLELNLPVNVSPGDKKLHLSILRNGHSIENITQSVTVGEVTEIRKTSKMDNRILVNQRTLSAENLGNAPKKVRLNTTIPSYLESLTSFSQDPNTSKTGGGETTYYWSFDLNSGETKQVVYTTRYWPPLVLISVIVVGLLVIRKVQSSVSVSKEVVKKENGLKVRIRTLNSSGSEIESLEVKDFVPDIASVKRDFEISEPVIRKTNRGTRLAWELEDLSPGEERVLEYTIEPLYEVEGGVNLPSAEIVVEDEKVAESGEVSTEFRP
ncbi:MAG: hypothetical protein H8Z69_03300 [Nanohaloarchaea archaeon]|nr:hypothetical protein [Candidatus Nanohaloarchaea archaeon]